ncbi:SH3 domain-containing protein [Gillisia sp. Hel1_33_143]|uniref:tetratricopeptide repeat protein n=1 Tax=Gillisia sp. Hel1_33_143 TaxID=1336796 RepID=UPI00087D1A06|nr:tetratricopeptide repeat protein [Gillisia sp. Hel1_33_143]SDR82967.1 SH3 domain-containing protein [Gillisia sp. Hel1_33_143]
MRNLFYILLFCLCLPVAAQNDSLFDKANTAYNEGDYNAAISNYQKIIDQGEASSELYYNLANAHYKLSHIAPSVYYYEKALKLDPNDKDVKNNLAFANNMVIDDIKEVPKAGISNSFNNFVNTLSYNTWAWIGVLFSALFAVFFILYYFSISPRFKRVFFGVAMVAVILMIFSVISGFHQKSNIQDSKFAIVFAEEVAVRSEPNLRGDEQFTLHEGTKIEVLNTYQNWVKLQLANGDQGWLEKNSLKFL